ncbi:recombinase RecA [bacterium (Candidatus Blackallbacteria) CG17_big_fil_post_rev_8_21_14_2_50_48_46]|uniref:Protein RecA n=1 Tax=bacterium (Candidatus Blackallbacteria) CG17_big_fil_post_rev_8_21_14_2_50_48_46 TaxID=2014261 RepID=A0A2M7FXX0_9BACT|nr:MAG: recombinase RecA [bacterium (Candidatus Blackallbacteria) CG18_big_fil_WC_8_21_14_2_50_49_26]PIW14133.1 MAG: recombinase RecA [bacterium (Candidatus Blackallbacteria) CG17_big_fil_post_rev_8_21_14_2_50_48_46]PIW45863.1 MAG: recombinase RecA [bacterium (Candidatus Blackallbacteria) CG13_big_fil_rev_8_21_14_2_50_49_14]
MSQKLTVSDEKRKALDLALSNIEKSYGKGSIMRLGEKPNTRVDAISTGALALDVALGVGGLPRGRVVEVFGQESGGKTTIALHAVAEAQRQGGIAAFIDVEHALDPEYAKAIGVDIDALLVSQPSTGEEALEITEQLIRSGAVDIIVVDSVAALVPKSEIEGEMGDAHVGLQARLMSQALRKLTPVTARSNTVVVFVNQLREKVGVMFGNPETTPGGRALRFYSSLRLEVRRAESVKREGEMVGNNVKIKVVKNKVAPPFKTAEVDMVYGKGISREGCVLDLAEQLDIIQKSGSWYSYQGEKIGQGRERAKEYLMEHPHTALEIENKVRIHHNLPSRVDKALGAPPAPAAPAKGAKEGAKEAAEELVKA